MQHWANNMGSAMKDLNPAVKESLTAQDHIRDAAKKVALIAEAALEMIAGERMSIDNLMSDKDIAKEALSTIRAARAQEPAEQEPDDWCDKIIGMEVSMDVSTGEHDIGNRIFGRVCEVMLQSCGAQEDTILVIEDSRNFAAPVQQVDLTDEEELELARSSVGKSRHWLVAAVIAAYKEKNK